MVEIKESTGAGGDDPMVGVRVTMVECEGSTAARAQVGVTTLTAWQHPVRNPIRADITPNVIINIGRNFGVREGSTIVGPQPRLRGHREAFCDRGSP